MQFSIFYYDKSYMGESTYTMVEAETWEIGVESPESLECHQINLLSWKEKRRIGDGITDLIDIFNRRDDPSIVPFIAQNEWINLSGRKLEAAEASTSSQPKGGKTTHDI